MGRDPVLNVTRSRCRRDGPTPATGFHYAVGVTEQPESAVMGELARLRMSIDNMDAALVHLLAERFKITQQVGVLKAQHGLPAADPNRESEQIARLRALAVDARLDPEFAEKFLNFVVAEVVRHHEAIAARG